MLQGHMLQGQAGLSGRCGKKQVKLTASHLITTVRTLSDAITLLGDGDAHPHSALKLHHSTCYNRQNVEIQPAANWEEDESNIGGILRREFLCAFKLILAFSSENHKFEVRNMEISTISKL